MRGGRVLALALWLAAAGVARAQQNVTISRMQLSLEETHELFVDTSIEFILDFNPNEEQAQYPLRVFVLGEGGHPTRPLLVTYRQRAGAGTWQVPWASGAQLQYELERTLCVDDASAADPPDCEDEHSSRGWVSLHVVSACRQRVRLRVTPARDWQLAFEQSLPTTATLTAPRVHHYKFLEGQEHVRLEVRSPGDVCATVAVQPLGCPIAEALDELSATTIRMTVQRSGATQLSRKRFPRGFLVVMVVHESDGACNGEPHANDDWLWAATFYGETTHEPPVARVKEFELQTSAALSRGQYALAAGATVGVFAAFYLAFLLLVLAQRWPPFNDLVKPRAVLAHNADTTLQSQTDTARNTSRRRDSTATFDSSDMSDSDESDKEADSRPTTATSPVRFPTSRTRSPSSPSSPTRSPSSPVRSPSSLARSPSPDTRTTDTQSRDDVIEPGQPSPDGSPPQPQDAVTNGVSYIDAPTTQNGGTEVSNTQNGRDPPAGAHPLGLPARLRVAALSRRRARVLRARADRYLTTLLTVAVFYALPALQFVFTFQIFLNVSGSLDTCYYNFLCAHPAGVLSDFNHVFSNLGYLVLGALFMLQLQRRRARRRDQPRHEEYGIPAHYGLLAALGAGMMVVALLSASYHVCPNRLNFQFDTSFMYVLAVLSMVKIYQSRHPDVNARAHATFGVLAVLIALMVWGVLGGGPLFWGLFTVLHVFTFLLLSLRIYYLGQFRFERETLQQLVSAGGGLRPLYTARLVMLLIANSLNWAIALWGLFNQSADFASHLLYVLLGNTLMYMIFYVTMKLLHNERPRWYAWAYTIGAAGFWVAALLFFTWGSSSWASSAARSRHLNHHCLALQFYDAHDLWHMLSAVALYLSFNAMLTWDDGLAAVPRTEIAVF